MIGRTNVITILLGKHNQSTMKSFTRDMPVFVNSPWCEKLHKHHVLIPYVAIKIVFIEMIDIGGTERERQAA